MLRFGGTTVQSEADDVPEGFHTFDPSDPPALRSRRCTTLLQHWNGLRHHRRFPSWAEIDPTAFKPVLPHVMVVGIEYAPFRVFYRLVGTEIVRFAKFDFTGRYADALSFQDDGAEDWSRFYREVVDAGQPGVGLLYWMTEGILRRWIEFVICPLSSDGTTIDRCISIEDYEHLNTLEIDTLPAVTEI
jgi:hypothetical protein